MGGQNFSFFTPLDLDALSRLKLGSKLRKLFVGQGIVLEESCLRDYQVLRSLRNEDSEDKCGQTHAFFNLHCYNHMHVYMCIDVLQSMRHRFMHTVYMVTHCSEMQN